MNSYIDGIIVRIISNLYTVKCDNVFVDCQARGKFRNMGLTPLVGDRVKVDIDNKYIIDIYSRRNELLRPRVANVDVCLIVTSLKHPDFSSLLLDKMLTNIILSDIEPIIVFSKYDLLTEEERKEFDNIINYYKSVGYKAILNTEYSCLFEYLKGKIVTLTGQTGAGKSTFINKLDPTLNLKTDDISEALGRGKHTTRHVELFEINDIYFIDTPGFSALDIHVPKENIKFAFKEFKNDECKFRDCKHINEIGCKVLEDVENKVILESRYENYKKMVME